MLPSPKLFPFILFMSTFHAEVLNEYLIFNKLDLVAMMYLLNELTQDHMALIVIVLSFLL